MGILTACKPRNDVLKGDLDDAIFAADFGDLISGTAPSVYKDSKTFFKNTYSAKELKKLVHVVFDRLADKKEPGTLVRLSTGFGGGKTHALMTLWHLGQNVDDPSIGTELLPAAGRPDKMTVVGIDAGKAGVPEFAKHGKTNINSLWGEIFFQLADEKGLKALGAADSPEASPNQTQLESVFPKGPVLILIDELVVYMGKLSDRAQGNLLGFLTNLISVVTKRPQTVLVITDPAGQAVYAAQANAIAQATAAAALKDVTGRKAVDIEPAKDEEAQIIVKRLFEKVDASAAQAASAEYHSLYARVTQDSPGRIPAVAASKDYASRIVHSYPFHPRLLDTARDRIAALQNFQKSRGVLRMFARILRDVWEAKVDLPLISAGEIDWSSSRIQADLLQRLDRGNFKPAVAADIEKHARELDEGKRGIHTRAASALLLESIPLDPNSGLDDPELTLAMLRPDESGEEPSEALERLVGVCWHLYPMVSGKGYQFRYDQNVLKQVEERRAKINREDATDRVRSEVQKYFGGNFFKLSSWPTAPKQVPDSAVLQLALCDNEAIAKDVTAHVDGDPQAPFPRRFRNAILAITAPTDGFEEAINRAQRLMALEAIEGENKTGESGKLVREQVGRLKPEFVKQFRLQANRAFNRVVFSSGQVHNIDEQFQVSDEQILQQPQGQEGLRKFLDAKKLIYGPLDALDSDLFLNDVLLKGTVPIPDQPDVYTARAVYERFLAAPSLRLVPSDSVVRNTLLKAVADDKIVVRFPDGRAYDAKGSVGGPTGNRNRSGEKLNALPLDSDVWVTASGSASGKEWLKEDAAQPTPPKKPGEPGGGEPWPPEPPKPPQPTDGPVAASGWDKTLEYAATRPLVELKVILHKPTDVANLLAAAPALSATYVELTVTVGGNLKDGGTMNFMASGVKPTHPAKPLTTAQTVFNALAEGSQYEAEVRFDFGADGRTGMLSALENVRQSTAVDAFITSQFAKAAGATA
ncbi:MAG TPA: DUF499 domain-containing protein [Candidatus Nanoarchaeia archaeon]|nr:DUF499 domain-containing protein [Candidatus Nanoarchaeia archaeon]